MWIIPGWAIGTAFVVIVTAAAQVVSRRLTSPGGGRGREGPAQGDTAALAQALEDLTRRLAELEERVDFAERMLAKERAAERLAPPEGERRA